MNKPPSPRSSVCLGRAAITRDVVYPILLLDRGAHVVRQLARDLDGVDALDVAIEALPLGHPRLARAAERDQALEHLRGAAVDLVRRSGEVQELLTVGAALVTEALMWPSC